MISMFENDTHFKTYTSERNSSFSANCNVLNALVHVPDPGLYLTQILKATTFLCKAWYDGPLIDKWVSITLNKEPTPGAKPYRRICLTSIQTCS